MEQSQTPKLATGGEPNPVDRTGLCLLSLDGGGVRGLSTLYILKSVMTLLNHERKEIGLPPVKPCEIFDLIGGTSTGGLIAIMLGRLEMDVDECISAYSGLMEAVFNERLRRMPVDLRGRVEPQFDSRKLKEAIEEVIRRRGASTTDLFNDGQERGCKVFVCTAAKELYGITRLRSYDLPQKPNLKATICEAALATSAATGFFAPVSITGRTFVDGALGANNPVDQVEEEAADIWCSTTGDLKPLVKCFISIGTGNPGKKALEDNIFKFLSKTLVQITTETEETAKRFIGRWRQHYDAKRYFRFNVEQGLQGVGLAEYREEGTIMAATDQYLDDQTRVSQVRNCVENLEQKQNRTGMAFRVTVEAYQKRVVLRQHNQLNSPRHSIPSQNSRFVGRTRILERIRRKLFSDSGHQGIALVGLGGVGKTQVALQIAHWTKENKPEWSVFWMPALSREGFEQATLELVEKLGIKGVDKDDPKELLRQYLSSSKSGNWLIVIDNADDEGVMFGNAGEADGICDYLPRTGSGRVLFTTRFRRIAVRIVGPDVVDVSQMNESEARDLLEISLINKGLLREEKVADLLGFLTYLPLAITQAAAYINKTTESVGEYLRLLGNTEQDLVELLTTEFSDDTRYPGTPNAVATTWVVSFEQIQKEPGAAKLLSFIAYTEPEAIPRSMLPRVGSEQMTTSAIGVLCGYSFLTRRDGEDAFDMHRLVHVASRVWVQSRENSKETRDAALKHLETIFHTDSLDNCDLWRKYLPHALAAIQPDAVDGDWGKSEYELGYWVGSCLRVEGRSREAVEVLEHVVAAQDRTHSEEDTDRLLSRHELARAYQANGQVTKAVDLLEHVVAVHRRTLSEDHPDRLVSQHTLAVAYQADGQVKKAVELLDHAVAVEGKRLPEDHPSLLASQHALASAYETDGQAKKAVKLLEHVVAVEGRSFSEDHPRRLVSQHTLAVAYEADGQAKKAVELLEHVVAVKGKSLSEDHPDRLTPQHELARAYQANGQVKEAVELLEHVVAVRGRTLTEDHPDRLASQHTLAAAYHANGQMKKAVELLEHVVAVHRKTLSEEHPNRLASQHELAVAYHSNGHIKKAVELLEQVVAVKRKSLSEDHPDRLASQNELAVAYQADGQVKKAVKLLEHVVAVGGRTLSEDHPNRLASQHTLAGAYQADGQVKKAVELLEHVVAVRGRTLSEDHPSRLISQHALADAYQANGQVKKAVKLLEHVVAVRGRTLSEDHPSLLASQHALASAYETDGQAKKAVKLLEHVVAVEGRSFSEDHPRRLVSQHTLAVAYEADGQVKKAVELLEHVVAVRGRTLTEEHPERLASQHELAVAYEADGQVKKAVELLEHVVAVRGRTLTEDHPSRLASQHELAMAYQADKKIKEAVELLEHVVAVGGKSLSEDHPGRLASQHELARAYEANEQVMKAVELLEHVVAIQGRTLPEEHPSRLISQHDLARAYQANGQAKKAVKLLEHVVAVRGRTLTEEHPSRLVSQHNLAMAYKTDGQAKKAVKLLEHVVAVEGRSFSEDHPSRLISQHALADAYQANGQVKKAVKLLEHVVAVRGRTLTEEHPDRLASQHELAMAYQADKKVKKAVKLLEHVVAVRGRTLTEEHPDRLASQHDLAMAYQADKEVKKAVQPGRGLASAKWLGFLRKNMDGTPS